MNKLYAVFAIAIAIGYSSQAQKIVVAPLAEKTIAGTEYGSSTYYKTRKAIIFGFFYQAALKANTEQRKVTSPFYGLLVGVPLIKCDDRIAFLLNTRVGLINRNFVVCTPGVETDIKIFNSLHLGVGMSFRKGALAGNTSLKIII